MKDVFSIPFPKPKRNIEKCQRWIRACGREQFTVEKVTRWTYICSKHFVGGHGPTELHPDPIPATYTPYQADKFSRKRKAPTPRAAPVSKKVLFDVSEALVSMQEVGPCPPSSEEAPFTCVPIIPPSTTIAIDQHIVLQEEEDNNPQQSQMTTRDCETQTTYHCSDTLANKIERRLRKNEIQSKPNSSNKVVRQNKFNYETLSLEGKLFKFYTGITVEQFNHLFKVLENVGNVYELKYWKGKKTKSPKKKRKNNQQNKITVKNQMLLVFMKLRQRLTSV